MFANGNTIADVEAGYAHVAYLYSIGAKCCMDYQATDHSQCVWHYPEREAELIAKADRRPVLICDYDLVPVWYPEENVHMPEACETEAIPGYTRCRKHIDEV